MSETHGLKTWMHISYAAQVRQISTSEVAAAN
jgi:hypothetical protein